MSVEIKEATARDLAHLSKQKSDYYTSHTLNPRRNVSAIITFALFFNLQVFESTIKSAGSILDRVF